MCMSESWEILGSVCSRRVWKDLSYKPYSYRVYMSIQDNYCHCTMWKAATKSVLSKWPERYKTFSWNVAKFVEQQMDLNRPSSVPAVLSVAVVRLLWCEHCCHDLYGSIWLTRFSFTQNVGYVFGSSTRGQRALYEVGLTGIPISNCNNNCSTGSTSLFHTRSLIAGGMARCALALGFEKMQVIGGFNLLPVINTFPCFIAIFWGKTGRRLLSFM